MFPDVLDQELQMPREDESPMFEKICSDSVGSSAFVVLQPCNGLLEFRVKWWGVQEHGWRQVWKIIQDMLVSKKVCIGSD